MEKEQVYWYPLSLATYGANEVLEALDSLVSFRTTMWSKTRAFEERFAELQGSREGIMVNSGSSADLVVAFALTNPSRKLLVRGDEILVPSVTWPTQIWSVLMAGLTVRLVDTDPRTLNVDLDDLEAKIGPRTRAISLVHLMGNPVDMNRIMDICRRHQLVLIEDCCEALGASFDGVKVGNFGTASTFSFFFSHHITTMEGGMISTNDLEMSDLCRLLRAHGWARNTKYLPADTTPGVDARYVFRNWGFNVRPTELQAGFGLQQLQRLPDFQVQRARNAEQVIRALAPYGGLLQPMSVHPLATCSWFALPFMVMEDAPFSRDDLSAHLEHSGVETRPIVAGNLTRQPAFKLFPELQTTDLPGADAVHERGIYIGLHPVNNDAMLSRLIELLDSFLRDRS